ncbi:methyltransferase family protein [Blastomonas natatoria]|uniref:Methyltransferase family protein n=1 Tax=Blastomonas natatoria TaxID=34015 RepID=A0A2V3VC99_9SPHN|nr:class I SAM-dependent methyltransferase [Blastomonas natatoria]PXW77705.1 methyltransferase family protein [Blastomonas natatoria]
MTPPSCRFCDTPLEHMVVDLGVTPLANDYLSAERLREPEATYPLRALVCTRCWLVQTDAFIAAEDIFSHYAYFSSYSASWVEHARQFTVMARERFGLTEASRVVEIASNDGYLLRHFIDAGIPVLGIEPAANVADVARAAGVPTESRFFGAETASDLVARGLSADLLIGNNVFAHVPDINNFVAGLATALKADGVVSLEFPHLLQLMQNRQFDTIYHEHFFYFSLLAVETVFARHGLKLFDVEELATHGGSLRILGCRADSNAHRVGPGLAKVRADEAAAELHRVETYAAFQASIEPIRRDLNAFLHRARAEGKHVAAYGAAAKGNTLLNFCGVTADLIDYVVDSNPHKQNHFLPGSRLPIHAPQKMAETRPDYVLILPWNIKDEIMATHDIQAWGGRFVVPVPALAILP